MNKHRILIVDDSPSELRILMEVLKNKYAIVVATSGLQAIQMVKEDNAIELVLLDVMMPDVNGHEACKTILEHSPNMPVVFVSGNDSTEEILTGFDVGAVDYLTKPIDTNVVSRKVEVLLNSRNKLAELESQNKDTSEMVMSVIASAGHLGTVLGFLRAGLKIKSHEGLLSALFDVFDGLNIDACVQLRTPKKAYNKATRGRLTPLEIDLLSRSKDMHARFLEKGTRYVVNFDSISVIIKNMPIHDAMALGNLRDNLMMILEDTNALNLNLISTPSAVAPSPNHEELAAYKEALLDIGSTLDMAAKVQEQQKTEALGLIDDMAVDFEESFFKLGLLENQENALASLVEKQTVAFSKHLEQAMNVEEVLGAIQTQIQTLVGKYK